MSKLEIITKPNLGKRIFAFIIDYGVIFCYTALMFYFYGTQDNEGNYILNGLPGLSVIVFWALVTIGSEQFFGVTLGNYMNDLKSISIKNGNNDHEISLGQSVKRHILDFVDIFSFGIIGIISVLNSNYNQRIGDMWAKTIVINTKDPDQGVKIVYD